jgi:hypothetical protein
MNTLPREIRQLIYRFRAKQWMRDLLREVNIDPDDFEAFLLRLDARVFGSFAIACMLNTRLYDDIDIIHPPLPDPLPLKSDQSGPKSGNNQVREAIAALGFRFAPGFADSGEEYTPVDFCELCASTLGVVTVAK